MASDELMEKYYECNERLVSATKACTDAKTLGEAEKAKDEYYMAAFGMIMIQNHIQLEMLTKILKILEK